MARIVVRPFETSDLEAAAALLATRQKRDRLRFERLEPGLESHGVCAELLAPLASTAHTSGVVALRDGRVAAFLFGEKMTFAPYEFLSMFIPPHSISIPVQGHAAEPGEELFALYRAMYGELAGQWVRQGFFVHQTHISASDAELQEAWVALGFGRTMTAAIRGTEPVAAGALRAGVEIHRASEEDLDVVMALGDTLFKFHSQSPMFRPFLTEPQAAAREFHRTMLSNPANGYFVAYERDRPVAMQTYAVPGFTPPIAPHERTVYLFEGVAEPDMRGGGLGRALLDRGMAWAREQGHEHCTLHFASGNPSGGPFWLGQGFQPFEYTMARHVDERVAWANGW